MAQKKASERQMIYAAAEMRAVARMREGPIDQRQLTGYDDTFNALEAIEATQAKLAPSRSRTG